MKISIVTPTFNRLEFLEETIESVVFQTGDFDLEYIVQDGGSDSQLIAILQKWKRRIDNGEISIKCNSLSFEFYIEDDEGMYDALNKGFSKTTGDVMTWLNSDDMYHPFALSAITSVFTKYNDVDWITGIPNSYNSQGFSAGFDRFPDTYSRSYIGAGYYDVRYFGHGFNWIQQESCFWRRNLWKKAGNKLNTKFKYAADFYLWQTFSEYADLVKVEAFLGGFRVHDNQITANPNSYSDELPARTPPPLGLKILSKVMRNAPIIKPIFFNKYKGFPVINMLGLRFDLLTGRTIQWSYGKNDWELIWKSIV